MVRKTPSESPPPEELARRKRVGEAYRVIRCTDVKTYEDITNKTNRNLGIHIIQRYENGEWPDTWESDPHIRKTLIWALTDGKGYEESDNILVREQMLVEKAAEIIHTSGIGSDEWLSEHKLRRLRSLPTRTEQIERRGWQL